ncbi:hybrid sensor histidine kinase/response regulator [Microvirga lenta]|uniref:hybrid sensor histidine kinase/response regulator n=1 Tax=Microvirga lenta TaxID=2881337 RepID=UPI001CFEF6CD|nr:hybrid sensor histidine kinase/response regulator [Microvirga lenta]MCB5174069.1 response regulator [Microvirga lenta]
MALGWLHHRSLFWRFLLIGIAALAPLVVALVQFAGDERDMALKVTRERAELLAAYTVERQREVIEEARGVLRFLTEMPEVGAGGPVCDAFLANHMALHRWIHSLRLSSPDGSAVCADRADTKLPDLHDREYFKKALSGADFVLSELTTDRRTGALAMVAAAPIVRSGEVVGVLSLGMFPGVFQERSPLQVDPTLDVSMFLVDQKGTLIAHHPQIRELVGASVRDRPAVQKALDSLEGSSEALDLFGVQRLFVFRTLPGTDAVLAIGLDRAAVIGAIDGVLRYRLSLITIIIGGSVMLGLLGAEILIFRPLRDLSFMAKAFESGDFSIRASTTGAGEVRLLARILGRMAEAITDREGELKAAKDVAESALAEARLANNAKTDFLATMSHEIRTPLNGIIGYTERLLDEELSREQRRYAELIQVAGSALLTIANDVLDLSSIEANQIQLRQEPFSFLSLIDDTVSIVSSGAGRKGVPIRTECDPDIPDVVLGDEARLRQILLNLLNNAVKFTRVGHITAHVQHKGRSERGELIRISIIDTGIGIAPEKRDRLFKRFSQVDRSIRREFGGTGLGLAISKRLIELMGGEIGVESEEGKGSTFWIEVALQRAEHLVQQQRQAKKIPATAPARILLAEDIEVNQELAKGLLVAAGHEVDTVTNGYEAVAAVQIKPYDLVLMDVQMPGMDGITATRKIRALDHPAGRIPILAMTANVLPPQIQQFKEAGMNGHVGKPVRRDDLLRKLAEWLPAGDETAGSPDTTAQEPESFNEKDFRDFVDMMGADRVNQWLARFDEQLETTFASAHQYEPHELAQRAHALVSQAALLGFSEFSKFCSSLEQACLSGGDISASLLTARRVTQETRSAIAGLLRDRQCEHVASKA